MPCHTGISTPIGNSHRNAVHLAQTHLSEIHILSRPIRTHFLYKINHIKGKVLSVLILINVQAKSDINLGGQGIVITNQGVAIQPCFHASKHMQFYKTGHWVVFIKLGQKHASKDGLNLPSSKPSGKSWPSGSGSRNGSSFTCSQHCSSTGSPSLTPWSTAHTNKHTIKTKICRRARNGNT